MNLRVIGSKFSLEVMVKRDFLKRTNLFLGPTQHPLMRIKSSLTTP
jgi:hypothetical protein